MVIYMVVLMMCFNLFSHGTQDLYPTFLQKQHNFDPATVSWIVIVANLGAIAGGLIFGHVSEKIGRVNAITVAALIALPALPLMGLSRRRPILLALGAFIMQVAVQGAWGVIPAHLNEFVAGRGARDHSGLRLSGRQFPRLLQRAVPGSDRPGERRQLRLRAGAGGGRGRGRDHRRHPLQPGEARACADGALKGPRRTPPSHLWKSLVCSENPWKNIAFAWKGPWISSELTLISLSKSSLFRTCADP